MYIRELVREHGYGIWVHNNAPGYLPIKIVERVTETPDNIYTFQILTFKGNVSFIFDHQDNFFLCDMNGEN